MPWARRACEGAGGAVASPAEGSQEYLGAPRGVRKPLETVKVLGEGSKTYFMYVLRPSILIKSVWFLHHHGGGRVESLVKNDNGPGGGFAARPLVSTTSEETTDQRMIPMSRIVEDVFCQVYCGGRRGNRVRRRT